MYDCWDIVRPLNKILKFCVNKNMFYNIVLLQGLMNLLTFVVEFLKALNEVTS